MGSFSLSISFSGTMLWQILQNKSAEKDFPFSLHYAVTKEHANTTKPMFRSFLPSQLPQGLLPTFVGTVKIWAAAISFLAAAL